MSQNKQTTNETTTAWFIELRNRLCNIFESLEAEYSKSKNLESSKFSYKDWQRPGGGGGQMAIMRGNLFEKVGVNYSAVHGEFSPDFRPHIMGADEDPRFFATGISVVAHMNSPFVPAAHFNTRYLHTSKNWFGGGGDLTPTFLDEIDTKIFHQGFKSVCDEFDPEYYPKFKAQCDEYFHLKHRDEARGVGGIFFDYYNTGNFERDFDFVKKVGIEFSTAYPEIIKRRMYEEWTKEQKEVQLYKRGRYVEFNLLYDRGTKFGLMTDGNVEAILMSLPPVARW